MNLSACSGGDKSPFNEKFKTMFDLSDIDADLNEFNEFYKESSNEPIERPQNPFHKNFQSYQGEGEERNVPNRNSLDS